MVKPKDKKTAVFDSITPRQLAVSMQLEAKILIYSEDDLPRCDKVNIPNADNHILLLEVASAVELFLSTDQPAYETRPNGQRLKNQWLNRLTTRLDHLLQAPHEKYRGKKLWALARTGQSASIKAKDVSNGYILLATACDGTMATTAQFTSIRVVCNNTLAIALKQGSSFNQGMVKVPHNTRFDAQAVKQQLGISISAWDEYIYQLNQLSNRKVKHAEVDRYLWQVFNDKVAPISSSFNERAMNKCKSLFEGHGRGAMLDSAKGTAFGLLNSVTEFVDHERRAKSTDHRLESAWFGNGAVIKQRALDLAGLMVA